MKTTKINVRRIKNDESVGENEIRFALSSFRFWFSAPDKPADGFLAECDLDQIDRGKSRSFSVRRKIFRFLVAPLSRKNRPETEERKVKTFERENIRLTKVVDVKELREHLDAVRNHLELEKNSPKRDFQTP